jgi:hypothetical protein
MKRRLIFNVHGVISKMIVVFITTAVRTSNPHVPVRVTVGSRILTSPYRPGWLRLVQPHIHWVPELFPQG